MRPELGKNGTAWQQSPRRTPLLQPACWGGGEEDYESQNALRACTQRRSPLVHALERRPRRKKKKKKEPGCGSQLRQQGPIWDTFVSPRGASGSDAAEGPTPSAPPASPAPAGVSTAGIHHLDRRACHATPLGHTASRPRPRDADGARTRQAATAPSESLFPGLSARPRKGHAASRLSTSPRPLPR